ncbi:hypothetical protein GCM10007301_18770 [Azorhizobium oxalatiphilum]|uniref:Uncharacterized protein n=1 Tax=Azorhizobium oxalatiphilum TaxID=980631 RepID=A0A917BWX9_9HYPH|nr:hypothetical protein [Azorhizobium oxalatiphilum]GGF59276.1 hypothetical protein GCM10007301_18770 [Azorhizobium oxalatiphilum]
MSPLRVMMAAGIILSLSTPAYSIEITREECLAIRDGMRVYAELNYVAFKIASDVKRYEIINSTLSRPRLNISDENIDLLQSHSDKNKSITARSVVLINRLCGDK